MIRAPFIVEGLLLGLFGAVIPLAGMTILYKRGLVYLNTNYQMITGLFELLPLKQIFPVMAGAAMALGVGIGAIVSFLTYRDICVCREEGTDEEPKKQISGSWTGGRSWP